MLGGAPFDNDGDCDAFDQRMIDSRRSDQGITKSVVKYKKQGKLVSESSSCVNNKQMSISGQENET